jgi:polysaccharide deacetylase family protein (PEP-CTERM system associated)
MRMHSTASETDPASVCAFTIDIEGFAESHAQSVTVEESLLDRALMDREIEENLTVTLDLLGEFSVRATFFFLGRIAQSSPHLVKRVADYGHEIACHSLNHLRITGQAQSEFRYDLRAAKGALEDASGKEVIGFRAPDFSIGRKNLWAIDELGEAGFLYDSSIVPTSLHDVYGMTNVPHGVFRWPNGLVEFPMPVVRVLGQALPFGGGGYFRLFPIDLIRRYFMARQRKKTPTAFYIHPYEIGGVAPQLPELSMTRRFRHYVKLDKGVSRLGRLLESVSFTTMADALTHAGMPLPFCERKSGR